MPLFNHRGFFCLSSAFLLGLFAGAGPPAPAQEGSGQLRGHIELKNLIYDNSRIVSKEISAIYQKNAVPAPPAYEPLNFVIYLDAIPLVRTAAAIIEPAAHPRLVMDQKGLTFVPHVLPILVGSTVEFPNSDPVYHNVFSFSKTRTFDLGRYPVGRSKTITFNRPGLVKVYCDMHSQMNAFILVLANPYFTVSDENGNYTLRDIPAGTYKVKVWFARLPEKTANVTIRSGETTTLDFVFQ